MPAHGTYARMNPPLRKEADRQALIAALADGTIDMVATDHAPHTAEEKAREFARRRPASPAWNRILGVQYLPRSDRQAHADAAC